MPLQGLLRNVCIVLVSLAFSACSSGRLNPPLVGRQAPLIQLYQLDGDQTTLNSYRGKTVVLLFWAQWCSRSQRIVRELNAFARDNRTRATVVGINIDKADKLGDLKTLIEETPLKAIDHYFSGNDIYDEAYVAFDIGEIPTVLILNPEGRVVAQGTSFDVVREYFKLP